MTKKDLQPANKDWHKSGKGRGRRKHKSTDAALDTVVRFRATAEEKTIIEKLAAEAGFSTSEFMRRTLTGKADFTRQELVEMTDVRKELRAQGRNLNQVARVLNDAALYGQESPDYLKGIEAAIASIAKMKERAYEAYEKTEEVFRLL